MNGKKLVIIILSLTAIVLSVGIYSIIAKKEDSSIPEPTTENYNQSEHQKELLIQKFQEEEPEKANKYNDFEIKIGKEDENWIYGSILFRTGINTKFDGRNFLARKEKNRIKQVAFMHSKDFNLWVEELPNAMFSEEAKVYLRDINPLLNLQIDRENLEQAVIAEFAKRRNNRYFKSYELMVFLEDTFWVRGLLEGYDTETPEPPIADITEFLARKDKNGKIIDLALIYSEKFDEWINIAPENIIPASQKKILYSSRKYKEIYLNK